MPFYFLILALVFAPDLFGREAPATQCRMAVAKVAKLQKRQKTIGSRLKELEKEFERLTDRDFVERSSGLFATLSRNRAKKTFFAKRRMGIQLRELDSEVKRLSEVYCPKCALSSRDKGLSYCKMCPRGAQCESATP